MFIENLLNIVPDSGEEFANFVSSNRLGSKYIRICDPLKPISQLFTSAIVVLLYSEAKIYKQMFF